MICKYPQASKIAKLYSKIEIKFFDTSIAFNGGKPMTRINNVCQNSKSTIANTAFVYLKLPGRMQQIRTIVLSGFKKLGRDGRVLPEHAFAFPLLLDQLLIVLLVLHQLVKS